MPVKKEVRNNFYDFHGNDDPKDIDRPAEAVG